MEKFYKIVKNHTAIYCVVCTKEIMWKKYCVFLPRFSGDLSRTRVGVRIHPLCFEEYLNGIKSITPEELDKIKKLEVVNNL